MSLKRKYRREMEEVKMMAKIWSRALRRREIGFIEHYRNKDYDNEI